MLQQAHDDFEKALARRAVLAWEGIGDADGKPIDPSPEAIDALLVPREIRIAPCRVESDGSHLTLVLDRVRKADVHDTFWIISRKCRKSRKGGTETHLELVQKGSLDFAAPEVYG